MNKVRMTKWNAKWNLEHPECWENPRTGRINNRKEFEALMKMCLSCLLDEPVFGTVVGKGADSNTFRIEWSHKPFGKETAYYEVGRDFTYEEK